MTAEMQQLANDPSFVVQFAVGDPIPNLIPQSKDSGIRMSGAFFDTTKRYIMKNAHMSKEDVSAPHLRIDAKLRSILCYSSYQTMGKIYQLFCLGFPYLGEDIRCGDRPSRHGIASSREESIREI